jgi:hypothetical protein
MRVATKLAIALSTIALCTKVSAQQTAVIINLTEQTAYLLEDGRVAFVSPIAAGKEGWGVLVQIFLSVCFCRVNDFADFRPPRPWPTFPERWLIFRLVV